MFRVKAEPSNEFSRHLERYGIFGIERIFICRKPLMKGVEIFINAITLGKYNKIKNEHNYDQIFHLYLMILLKNGMWMLLEKNEQVELKPSEISEVNDFQHIMVTMEPNTLSLREFVDNAIQVMGKNEFHIYDGLTSNCQMFVTDVLGANNLWNTKYDLFVNQSITTSLKEVKGLKTIMRKITDVGAIANQIMGRGGCGGMKAGTDETFLISHLEKNRLENALKGLDEIDIRNLHERNTKNAYDLFIKSKNIIDGIYSKRGKKVNIDSANFTNSNRGFGYIASFDENDKTNKENLKESISLIKKMINRILKYNSTTHDIFDTSEQL